MTPTLHSIPAPASSPVARIDGGEAHHHSRPAVTSFAHSGKSVAPAVSGFHAAGDALHLRGCPPQLAGGFGSRRFSRGLA